MSHESTKVKVADDAGGQSLAALQSALAACPYKELQRVVVQLSDKTVRLDGQTSSFFMKQMAQEIARATTGLKVDNSIQVMYGHCHN